MTNTEIPAYRLKRYNDFLGENQRKAECLYAEIPFSFSSLLNVLSEQNDFKPKSKNAEYSFLQNDNLK